MTKQDDNTPAVPEPASDLAGIRRIFHPAIVVDPGTDLYEPRNEVELTKLAMDLADAVAPIHAFVCGHRGSGKSTELGRLVARPEMREAYETLFLSAADFGNDAVDLTHDALLVEIGLVLAARARLLGVANDGVERLEAWGAEVVKTVSHVEGIDLEAGVGAALWARFKAQLRSRRDWKTERSQLLEPNVQDLIRLVDELAQDLALVAKKRVLVIVDDLEKGESDAHKAMHNRLFHEQYDALVQPRFAIVYTLPVYFRSLPATRVPQEQMYAFPAARLYAQADKHRERPPIQRDQPGYRLMHGFVKRRLAATDQALIRDEQLEELLLMGGGLFRETARAVREAATHALIRGAECIEPIDVEETFHRIKKDYQPMIRGQAVGILKQVLASDQGWVPDVERYLQSRAVVEYENHDCWLDLRYPLKRYVGSLADTLRSPKGDD